MFQPTPQTVKEIATETCKSETYVRTAIRTALADGYLIKHPGKPARYSETITDVPPAPKKRKGNLNPQSAINKMVKQAKEYAIDLTYNKKGRNWSLGEVLITGKELAELRSDGFEEYLAETFIAI